MDIAKTFFTPTPKAKANGTDPIEVWRAEKAAGDKARSIKEIVGCVGAPLVEPLEELLRRYDVSEVFELELVEALEACRDNLVDLVSGHRRSAAEMAFEAAGESIEYMDSDSIRDELDSSKSPDDAADLAFEHAARALSGCCYEIDDLDDWTEL